MYSTKLWEAKKEELAALEKQREEISKRIHLLKVEIRQHEKRHSKHKVNTNTEVYKMFGKPLKDLTEEERKIYYNARQQINRQKRKQTKA